MKPEIKVGDIFIRNELADGDSTRRIVRVTQIDTRAYSSVGKICFEIMTGSGARLERWLDAQLFRLRYSKMADPNKIWKELNQ
jgi:hypothetical protein